nr:endothelin-converting enzyme 1-like [Dermacentor andersoni]
MLPRTTEERSKKLRASRTQSSASITSDISRSSSSSGKSKAKRKIPSGDIQDGTDTSPQESVPLAGTTTTAANPAAVAGTSEPTKGKGKLSFFGDELRKASDAAAHRDGSTNGGPPDPTATASPAPSFSKQPVKTDGLPPGLPAVQGDRHLLSRERDSSQLESSSQPAAAAAAESTPHASHRTCVKEQDGSSSQLLSAQSTRSPVRQASDANLTECRPNLPDTGSKATMSVATPSSTSPGATAKLVAPNTAEHGEYSKSRCSRSLSGPRDPRLEHRSSLSSFLHLLKEQQPRGFSSKGFECDARRVSGLVVTVAGVPITKRQLVVTTIFVFFITVASIIVGIMFMRKNRSVPSEPLCETEDCLRHSYRLFGNLNRSLDPCENFSAYVCSAWSPPQRYLEHSNSAMDDVRKSWFPRFNDVLRQGSKIIRAGLKPLAMYSSCMGDRSEYGSNVEIFWNFFNECRLTWPEKSEPGSASALEVLMTLALKWQVPLFFQVRALRLESAPNWRITMDPGSLIPLMYQHHLTVKHSGGYDKYWATFYFILSGKHDGSAVNKTIIDSALTMEGDVYRRLLTNMRPAVVHPVLATITDIGAHTPSVDSEQWLHAFRQSKLEPEVEHSDQVLLSDAGFFRAFADVMASYKDPELLSLIAWSFVQLFSPAVDYRLLENRYDQGVTIYRPYFCERFVETPYRFLVIALGSVALFTREERSTVSACFDSLVSAAVDMVNASEWLDTESRQLAAEKLSSTRLKLWPPAKYLESDALDSLYKVFPSAESSFAEYWVKSSRCAADIYRPRPGIDVWGYTVNYALPYLIYDAASNSVKVAVGAVTKPLYYAGGTKAMLYGGLGFSMALQLVASLDSQGIRWHPSGTFGDSFLSKDSVKGFEERDGCLAKSQRYVGGNAEHNQSGTGKIASVFPEIPAIEVAYAAYRHSLIDGGDEVPRGIPGGLSGDQVFFMTLCYMTCTLPGAVGPQTVDCNKAVRSSEAFARAFRCPLGSPMNPRRKCTFFT